MPGMVLGLLKPIHQRLVRPIYLHLRYIGSRWTDRMYGITTADESVDRALGWKTGYCRRVHRALPFTWINRIMRRLDPGPGDALLDIGCGAGRVICVAAKCPMARIIGIDLDERVSALAERNARSLRRFRTRPEVVCTDATRFHVPEEISIIFMNNPFDGDVLKAALARIIESFDRAPRRIRIVYANPRCHDVFTATGRLRHTGLLRMSWRPGADWNRTQTVRLYEVEPPVSLPARQSRTDAAQAATVAVP